MRLSLFQMRDNREVLQPRGFALTEAAKAKLYDIHQEVIRSVIECDDWMIREELMPISIAGRIEFLDRLYRGYPIVDENGNPTGEFSGPMISKETYLRLLQAPGL